MFNIKFGHICSLVVHDIAVAMLHVDQLSEEDVEASLHIHVQLSEPLSASTLAPDDANIMTRIGKFICIEILMCYFYFDISPVFRRNSAHGMYSRLCNKMS